MSDKESRKTLKLEERKKKKKEKKEAKKKKIINGDPKKSNDETKSSGTKKKSKQKKTSAVSKNLAFTEDFKLVKCIKDKSKNNYSIDELKVILSSVKEPKSGFPTYRASIFDDRVTFEALKKGKKIKPIKYSTIGQIVHLADDYQTFLIHVPKAKGNKQFTGVFMALDPDAADRFEKAVNSGKEKLAAVATKDRRKSSTEEHRQKKTKPGPLEAMTHSSVKKHGPAKFTTPPLSYSSCDRRTPEESREFVLGPKVIDTFTYYIPNQTGYRMRHSTDESYSTNTYEDSGGEEEFDDSDYICRDKFSVFYGERMSPKSQYIERLLRETVRMQQGTY